MIVHRVGGGQPGNLLLKPLEKHLSPPGISILLGGTPHEAAQAIRAALPHATRLHQAAAVIGSAAVDDIRAAGFDVLVDPSHNLPNHARLIHPNGLAGFTLANLARLALVFTDTQVGGP